MGGATTSTLRPDARTARLAVDDAMQRRAGGRDPVEVADDPVTEVGGRYIDFLIPGLVGLSLWGALSFTGVAMLIAACPRSIEVASGWANLVMLPMWPS